MERKKKPDMVFYLDPGQLTVVKNTCDYPVQCRVYTRRWKKK